MEASRGPWFKPGRIIVVQSWSGEHMAGKQSAGILLYRRVDTGPEVFLVHPGGPYWARKDLGAWSIPKGEVSAGEDPLATARREFLEETGNSADGAGHALQPIVQAGGKRVQAWAVEGEFDPATLVSNSFTMEWPPRSGNVRQFPEVDKGEWFSFAEARARILPAQCALLDELEAMLAGC